MTTAERIALADRLKPNAFSEADKELWLSELDDQIKREVFDTHVSGDDPQVPEAHEGIYIDWLHAKYDYYGGEFVRYQNAAARFNSAYLAFQNDWNRNYPAAKQKNLTF